MIGKAILYSFFTLAIVFGSYMLAALIVQEIWNKQIIKKVIVSDNLKEINIWTALLIVIFGKIFTSPSFFIKTENIFTK